MKKLILPTAVAIALLAPMTSARADSFTTGPFCTTGLSLNFCGSVEVTATAAAGGGTNVTFKVLNTSSGTPLASFIAVGINNAGLSSSATYSNFVISQGTLSGTGASFGWVIAPGSSGGVAVTSLAGTEGEALAWSISSQCSGSDPRFYTGCGNGEVTISFHTSDNFMLFADGNLATSLYVNAAAESGACITCPSTVIPEPATIALVATGLLGMGGPISRWRRRRST